MKNGGKNKSVAFCSVYIYIYIYTVYIYMIRVTSNKSMFAMHCSKAALFCQE